jgi:hypothetical protein
LGHLDDEASHRSRRDRRDEPGGAGSRRAITASNRDVRRAFSEIPQSFVYQHVFIDRY